jgi:hypothetical protein
MPNITLTANSDITEISCSRTGLLGGIVNIEMYPNIINFTCAENAINEFLGFEKCPKLVSLNVSQNEIIGRFDEVFAKLDIHQYLQDFRCYSNNLTGTIPDLSQNTALTNFYVTQNQLGGTIPSLSANVNLSWIACGLNQLTGAIPDLSQNIALESFHCYNNQLSGSIPSLSANVNLTSFVCRNNSLNGFTGGVSDNLGDFQAQNNNLSSTAVNAILAAFVSANCTTGPRVLNLGGTGNAAPTGRGLSDEVILASRGWTITTN